MSNLFNYETKKLDNKYGPREMRKNTLSTTNDSRKSNDDNLSLLILKN